MSQGGATRARVMRSGALAARERYRERTEQRDACEGDGRAALYVFHCKRDVTTDRYSIGSAAAIVSMFA